MEFLTVTEFDCLFNGRKLDSAKWTVAHRMRLDTSPNPAKQTKLSNWENKRNVFLPGCRFLASRIFRNRYNKNQFAHQISLRHGNEKNIKRQQVARVEVREQWVRRRCCLLHAITLAAALGLGFFVYWADTHSSCQCPKTLDSSTKPNDHKNMKKKKRRRRRRTQAPTKSRK